MNMKERLAMAGPWFSLPSKQIPEEPFLLLFEVGMVKNRETPGGFSH